MKRSVSDDAKPWSAFPLLVLYPDLKAGAEQSGGSDLVAFGGKDAAGVVELDETASGEKEPRRAHLFSFQNEVVTDQLVGGPYLFKSMYNL